MTYRKLTLEEFHAEAKRLFPEGSRTIAFQCPSCGDVATVGEFRDLNAGESAGQHCIGRDFGPQSRARQPKSHKYQDRGCDWAAYGLLSGPWEIVFPAEDDQPERSVWSFPFAQPAGGEPS